ncbi:MAG: zinc ribbon domain-containing protein [Candidatus Eremiobacteraeota bacterium]|nr:zinc ribbon domain-containing protein [Candidatus Eremiobacteraeota bacterium]
MKCPNCGTENAAGMEVCSNCGATLAFERRELAAGARIGLGCLGVVLGIGATFLIVLASSQFGRFSGPGYARGTAIGYLLSLVCATALLVFILGTARGRLLVPGLRVLVISALVVILGGMSICIVPSIIALFVSS